MGGLDIGLRSGTLVGHRVEKLDGPASDQLIGKISPRAKEGASSEAVSSSQNLQLLLHPPPSTVAISGMRQLATELFSSSGYCCSLLTPNRSWVKTRVYFYYYVNPLALDTFQNIKPKQAPTSLIACSLFLPLPPIRSMSCYSVVLFRLFQPQSLRLLPFLFSVLTDT